MLSELLEKARAYINGLCTLRDLEEWILSNLQRILDSGDADATEIANQLDADLVALTEDLIDERTLRDNLLRLISLQDSILCDFRGVHAADDIQISNAAETIRTQAEVPGAVVDHRWNLVFA